MVLSSLFASTPSRQKKRRCSCSGTFLGEVTPSPQSTGCVRDSPDDDSIGYPLALALLLDRRNLTIMLATPGRRSGTERIGERGCSCCAMRGEDGGELKEIMLGTISASGK